MDRFEIFLPMQKIPTITHQQKDIKIIKGKPVVYEPQELKDARALYTGKLYPVRPETPIQGPVSMIVKFCFDPGWRHKQGEWKISKPDTDNMIKLLKDCMTAAKFWLDDAQVAQEVVEKVWWEPSGIYIRITGLEDRTDGKQA